MMLVDSDPFYDHEVDELEDDDEVDDEEDDMSEMGGAAPSSRHGGGGASGVGNATLVAGEKRKHRDRAL